MGGGTDSETSDCLETMENWDEAQLAEVVESKHGEDNKKKNSTQIVSAMRRQRREAVDRLCI